MARTSAALLATAILAASAVHVVYAGIRPNGGLQYPGITGVIPACVCCPSPVLVTSHQEHTMQSAVVAPALPRPASPQLVANFLSRVVARVFSLTAFHIKSTVQ